MYTGITAPRRVLLLLISSPRSSFSYPSPPRPTPPVFRTHLVENRLTLFGTFSRYTARWYNRQRGKSPLSEKFSTPLGLNSFE